LLDPQNPTRSNVGTTTRLNGFRIERGSTKGSGKTASATTDSHAVLRKAPVLLGRKRPVGGEDGQIVVELTPIVRGRQGDRH